MPQIGFSRPVAPLAPVALAPGWKVRAGGKAPQGSLPNAQGKVKQQRSFEPESEPDAVDEFGQAHRIGYHGP